MEIHFIGQTIRSPKIKLKSCGLNQFCYFFLIISNILFVFGFFYL
jgi:hypothetical protein